jgi:hypothetical protein
MAGYLKRALGAAILVGVLAFGAAGAAWAKVELSMYYPVAVGGPLTKIVDGLVADFMKENPDIDVKAIYAGNYNDARIKALAALKSGQPAQLSVMFAIDIYELIEQDAIVAFDDIVETDEEKAWLTKFYPALMENGITGGKTWGIPFQRSTIVMYYNKDAFRDAGLDPENPPATWDELVDAGQKLVKKDASGQIERWGIMIPSTGYPYWMFGALAMQNDQVLMNSAGNETFFDAPSTVGALEFWLDLGKTHKVMPQGTIEWGTLHVAFHRQSHRGEGQGRVRLRRCHVAGQQAAGNPHRRWQLLYLQADHARRTQGGDEAHPLPDRARAHRGVEHEDRLSRHPAGCIRDPGAYGLRGRVSAGRGGARSARFRDRGALDIPDRSRSQVAGRCHPGGFDRRQVAGRRARCGAKAVGSSARAIPLGV